MSLWGKLGVNGGGGSISFDPHPIFGSLRKICQNLFKTQKNCFSFKNAIAPSHPPNIWGRQCFFFGCQQHLVGNFRISLQVPPPPPPIENAPSPPHDAKLPLPMSRFVFIFSWNKCIRTHFKSKPIMCLNSQGVVWLRHIFSHKRCLKLSKKSWN